MVRPFHPLAYQTLKTARMASKKTVPQKKECIEKCPEKPTIIDELAGHFKPLSLNELITASRRCPMASRVDLQTALDYLLSETYAARLIGVHRMYNQHTLAFSDLLITERPCVMGGPLQYVE